MYSSDQKGTLGDIFSPTNALIGGISLLALLFTIYLQIDSLRLQQKEMSRTAESNAVVVKENKINSIVNLFETFTNSAFVGTRVSAWQVLSDGVNNYNYSLFLINTLSISGSADNYDKTSLLQELRSSYSDSDFPTLDDLQEGEEKNRYELTKLMNFYALLALNDIPKTSLEKCDFFYEWWRPLFWYYAMAIKLRYENSAISREYDTRPTYVSVLSKLDGIYEFEPITEDNIWSYLNEHPIIKEIGLDPDNIALFNYSHNT